MYVGFSVLLLAAAFLYALLSPAIETARTNRGWANLLTLPSRRLIFTLTGLFALDSFAGSLFMQSLAAYWFYTRFGLTLKDLALVFSLANALAAISFVQKKVPGSGQKDLILVGESLGGAVLARALEDVKDRSRIRRVVLDSTFFSYQNIARRRLSSFWLTWIFQPLAWVLVSDSYSPEKSLGKISPVPVLIIHGTADHVIPFDTGQHVYELAREPKTFWKIEGGEHIDAMGRENGKYRKMLIDLLK